MYKDRQCVYQDNERTQCFKIGSACIRTWSRKPSQNIKIGYACIMMGDACIKSDIFRHCETFSKKIFELTFSCRPARPTALQSADAPL